MTAKSLLDPHSPRARKPPFAMGVHVGDTIYVSGHVSQDTEGNVIGEGDMARRPVKCLTVSQKYLRKRGQRWRTSSRSRHMLRI